MAGMQARVSDGMAEAPAKLVRPVSPVQASDRSTAASSRVFAGTASSGRPLQARNVLAFQARIGNRRTTALVQRQQVATAPPNQSVAPPLHTPAAPAPATGPLVTADQQAQLLRASTTLKAVPPLGEAEKTTLQSAIPGAAVYDMIQKRDAERAKLAERTQWLKAATADVGTTPEHGVAHTQQEVDDLAKEVTDLTKVVETSDKLVAAALKPLGIEREDQLLDLVTVRFPATFLERAKQIAQTELDRNMRFVEKELHRYGLDVSIDPAARQALIGAARDLAARDDTIVDLEGQLKRAQEANAPLPGGVRTESETQANQAKIDDLTTRLNTSRAGRTQRHSELALEHPLLLRPIDLKTLAKGDDASFDAIAGGELREIAENIDDTKDNVASGRLKVWNLPEIMSMTTQDLGVGGTALEEVVQKRVATEVSAEADVKMALAALSITAGLIATFATGGFALAAGAVAVGVGGYQASESVKDYMAESAAGAVALDPRVADLSKGEPELFWLVLDLVGVVADAADVVKVFKALRPSATALKVAKDATALNAFSKAAHGALPAAAAKKVVGAASRHAGTAGAVGRSIEAVGTAFRKADLVELGKRLEQVADKGYKAVFDNLNRQGRVLPLTEKAVKAALGEKLALELMAEGVLTNHGYYHFGTKKLFIKPGSMDVVASTVVHETTHWIQHTQHAKFVTAEAFMMEFQAFAMEQRYLKSVVASSGLESIPADWLWLLSANQERITKEIVDLYKHVPPESLDLASEVADVMKRLKAFTS